MIALGLVLASACAGAQARTERIDWRAVAGSDGTLEPGAQWELVLPGDAVVALPRHPGLQVHFAGPERIARSGEALPDRLCPAPLACWSASDPDAVDRVLLFNGGDAGFEGPVYSIASDYNARTLAGQPIAFPDLPVVSLQRGDSEGAFQRIRARSPVVEVEGPAILEIRARLTFSSDEAADANARELGVAWYRDDELVSRRQERLAMVRSPARLDGVPVLATAALEDRLVLGDGLHRIALELSKPAWVELSGSGGDFLWPGQRRERIEQTPGEARWLELRREAAAMASGGSGPDPAGAAADWLSAQAVRWTEWKDARALLLGATFWDPILPLQSVERRVMALLDGEWSDRTRPEPLALTAAESAWPRPVMATFYRVSGAVEFALPPTSAPALLRVRLLEGGQGELRIRAAGGRALSIRPAPEPAIDAWWADADTAALYVRDDPPGPPILSPLWRPTGLAPGMDRVRGSVVLPLPAGASTVRVESAGSAQWIELAMTDTITDRLSPADQVALVEADAEAASLAWRDRFDLGPVAADIPLALRRHWRDLAAKVRAQIERVERRLAPAARGPVPGGGALEGPLQRLLGEGDAEAVVTVADRLRSEDEDFLLDRFLTYAMLRLPSPEQRRRAREWAQAHYREQLRFEPLESLLYAQWLRRGDAEAAAALLDWLAWQGAYDEITTLWPGLDSSLRCHRGVLQATWREPDDAIFRYCLDRLEPVTAGVWHDHRRILESGDDRSLREADAGDEAHAWSAWHESGRQLRRRLAEASDPGNLLADWLRHRGQAPGARRWRRVTEAHVSGGEQRALFNVERLLDLERFLLSPGQTLTLSGAPGERIRIEARAVSRPSERPHARWALRSRAGTVMSGTGFVRADTLRLLGEAGTTVSIATIGALRLDETGQARLRSNTPLLLDFHREGVAIDVSPLPGVSALAYCWLRGTDRRSDTIRRQPVFVIEEDGGRSLDVAIERWSTVSEDDTTCVRDFRASAKALDVVEGPSNGRLTASGREGRWRRFEQFEQTAGMQRIAVPASAFVSPRLSLRAQLSNPPLAAGERLFFGTEAREIDELARPIQACVDAPFFLPNPAVAVRVGEREAMTVPACPELREIVSGDAARQGVSVHRVSGEPFQFLRLVPADADASRFQRFHVAQTGKPLVFSVLGPKRIRVDEWDPMTGRQSSIWQVPAGRQERTFATDGQERRYFRFFEFVEEEEADMADCCDPPAGPPALQLPERPLPAMARRTAPEQRLRRSSADEGTKSLHATLRWRRFDDFENAAVLDRFLEVGGTLRRFEPETGWRRYRLAGRVRADGSPSVHANAFWRRAVGARNWYVDASTSLHLQQPADDIAYQAYATASLNRQFSIATDWRYSLAVGGFGRHLREPSAEGRGERIDLDVFSDYKADHRSGLHLRQTLIWEVFEDLTLRGGLSVNSNEIGSDLSVDNTRTELSAETQWRGLGAELSWTRVGLRDDTDRTRRRSLSRLGADLFIERWRDDWGRWQVGIGLNYDLDERDLSGQLIFEWHGASGRGMTDFLPWERRFRTLREAGHAR